MRNFQDTFEIRKRLFISGFLISMTVSLNWLKKEKIKITTFLKFRKTHLNNFFNTKKPGGRFDLPYGFSKDMLFRCVFQSVKLCFLVSFNFLSENFIEIPQVFQKI